jgi:hypothetical protein
VQVSWVRQQNQRAKQGGVLEVSVLQDSCRGTRTGFEASRTCHDKEVREELGLIKLFSSTGYLDDPVFQELMIKWNRFLHSQNDDEEILDEWENTLMSDFYRAAHNWMKIHMADDTWRCGVE